MNARETTGRSARRAAAVGCLLLAAGAAAPLAAQGDFRLPGLNGGALTTGDLRQGTTIVVVWASWSPRGHDVTDRVSRIARTWSGSARVVTVNFQEDAATVQKFLAGRSLGAPVYLDTEGTFSKKYSVTALPGLIVFKDGQPAYRGRLPEDPDSLIRQVVGSR